MSKFWNWIEEEETETTETGDERERKPRCRELRLEGVIAEETWWGDEVTPKMFRDELFADSGDVTVWINSPGGDVIAASTIYTMLREYRNNCGNVNVKIDGMAASAASVIAMAGTEVSMSPTAMMMIHNPMTYVQGNREEMERAIQLLDEVKESIINAYEEKTGLSRARISHMMNNETWMSAGQAFKLGFIDEILYDGRSADNGGTYNVYQFSQAVTNMALIRKVSDTAATAATAYATPMNETADIVRDSAIETNKPDGVDGKAIATDEKRDGVDAKVLMERLMSKKYY